MNAYGASQKSRTRKFQRCFSVSECFSILRARSPSIWSSDSLGSLLCSARPIMAVKRNLLVSRRHWDFLQWVWRFSQIFPPVDHTDLTCIISSIGKARTWERSEIMSHLVQIVHWSWLLHLLWSKSQLPSQCEKIERGVRQLCSP